MAIFASKPSMWLAEIVSAKILVAVIVFAETSVRIASRAEMVAAVISPSTVKAGVVAVVLGEMTTGASIRTGSLDESGEMVATCSSLVRVRPVVRFATVTLAKPAILSTIVSFEVTSYPDTGLPDKASSPVSLIDNSGL